MLRARRICRIWAGWPISSSGLPDWSIQPGRQIGYRAGIDGPRRKQSLQKVRLMAISMSQASIPAFIRTLTSLSAILDKAGQHAASRKIDPAVLLGTRLFPDMFPLTKQVQLACDFAKGG